MRIPLLTSSMTKAIRTSEGIMAWVITLGTGALSYIEGIEFIPHQAAAIIIAANAALHIASRTLLKIFALQKEIGIEEPIPFIGVPAPGTSVAEAIVAPKITADSSTVALSGAPQV